MFQHNMLAALSSAGFRPEVALSFRPVAAFPRGRSLRVPSSSAEIEPGLNVQLLPFLNISPLKQLLIGVSAALRLVRWSWSSRARPRVMLTYNLTVPSGLLTWAAMRLTGAKAVAFVADINVPGQTVPNSLYFHLDFLLHRWLIPRFDGLIVVSDAVLKDFAPHSKALRVEGGISEALVTRQRTPRPDDGQFVLVATGSLDDANGIREIVDAFRSLNGDRFRLVVAGAGPLEQYVRKAAAQDPRIEYAGFVRFDQVVELYDRADALVCMRITRALNTKYFFPSKLMEYFASGTPVITTCPGHVAEEFSDVAYLLHDETAEGLVKLVLEVSSRPREERQARARCAFEYMATQKTWAAQARKIRAFLTDVAGTPG
jgi:glycosyltransferase involved in cell wall biosynthesis